MPTGGAIVAPPVLLYRNGWPAGLSRIVGTTDLHNGIMHCIENVGAILVIARDARH